VVLVECGVVLVECWFRLCTSSIAWSVQTSTPYRCQSAHTYLHDYRSRVMMSPPRRERGVCLSVCPVPRFNSRTERRRKPKIGTMKGRHKSNQETYIEVKRLKIKVTRSTNV